MTIRVVTTGDGSSTLHDSCTAEHYHSIYGAITESVHVFINSGLNQIHPGAGPLNILEVGFGTGLNALLTLIESEKLKIAVRYDALEPFPVLTETAFDLNYPEMLGPGDLRAVFEKLHTAGEGNPVDITPLFSLNKIRQPVEESRLPDNTYQLVYFDAFSPNVQPRMWQPSVFAKLHTAMKENGLLLTYCAKGDVARALSGCGFLVEKLPGPPGKRHMLRGRKSAGGK